MTDLPRLALSIRQPWAFTIVAGWKPVENRSWRAPNPGLKFRGPFAVHASGGMTRAEYDDCADLCEGIGFTLPSPDRLLRGGIVVVATVVDIVKQFDSPWFFGPRGLVLADAKPVDFIPVGGHLGFFEWRRGLIEDGAPMPPAKWMVRGSSYAADDPPPSPQMVLL